MKKDLLKYFNDCLNQSVQVNQSTQRLQKELDEADCVISKDQVLKMAELAETMNVNCQRLAYAVYLLNMPLFDKARFAKKWQNIINFLKGNKADSESVIAENQSIVDQIEVYIKEIEQTTLGITDVGVKNHEE